MILLKKNKAQIFHKNFPLKSSNYAGEFLLKWKI